MPLDPPDAVGAVRDDAGGDQGVESLQVLRVEPGHHRGEVAADGGAIRRADGHREDGALAFLRRDGELQAPDEGHVLGDPRAQFRDRVLMCLLECLNRLVRVLAGRVEDRRSRAALVRVTEPKGAQPSRPPSWKV